MPEHLSTNTTENKNFQKLAELFPQIVNGEYSYMRLEAGAGFMPLSVEWIGDNQLSIMHTYTQNGDLMYDPMIVMEVDREAKTANAVEFQQSNPPLYQRIEDGIGHSIDGNGRESVIKDLQRQINDFSSDWFNNIAQQGYMPERANAEINGDDVRINFDKDGKPIMPEAETTEQQGDKDTDILFMPDPAIGFSERDLYGYTRADMLPLTVDTAYDLYMQDNTIYLLFNDNSEEMVFDSSEINNHKGIFGIDRDEWLKSEAYADLVVLLEGSFNSRLLYVGLQGSYLRNEANENSDIDIMVIIDDLSINDLELYKKAVGSNGNSDKAYGFICGKAELANWNPYEICHLTHTTKDYYGKLLDFVPKHTKEDERNFIKMSLNNLYHGLCHGYIHSASNENKEKLPFAYKSVFFILQNIYFMKTGVFVQTKNELLSCLSDDDLKVFAKALEIGKSNDYDFEEAFTILFSWCKNTIIKI